MVDKVVLEEKILDNYKIHNPILSKLFIDKENELKPTVSASNDRMVGYQWFNQQYNIFTWKIY